MVFRKTRISFVSNNGPKNKFLEVPYISYDDIELSQTFLEEFTFSQQNIDIFSSEASHCENVIYPIIRDVNWSM